MNDSWNNVKTVCCKPWLVLPTVYSDALSYGEQLDKFCYCLNKIIENNNILPDYINDKIKEYISSGAIGEVVREILANYILNVKYPPKGITPAVGDGSADDTEALQGCIDYASENGGVVYFPYGSYLTQPLTMKSGVSLFGFDRYSTKVVLNGGATKALLNGNGNNLSVCNLTLDGNSGIQVSDVNVVDMTGNNLMFNDLVIKDGYKLFNFVGDGHLQLSNIVFGNAVENCFTVDGNVIVQTNNLLFTALSKVSGVSVVDIKANGGNYDFNSVAKCDTCMLISGNDNNVVAMIGGANEDYVDTGEHNNIEIVGHSQKEYYYGNIKKDANNSETTLQGTRSLHVVGASTFAVDGNSTESVDGNKSEIVTGVTSETYKNTKTTKGTVYEETYTNNKTTNAKRVILNTEDDLRYNKMPVSGKMFDTLPYYDLEGNKHDLLVENDRTDNIQFVNAKLYGAYGDNVHDDSDVIQALLDMRLSVYLPAGTYYLSKGLTWSDSFVFGDGMNTHLRCLPSTKNMAICNIGSRGSLQNILLEFDNSIDMTSLNPYEYVGIATFDLKGQWALQRTVINSVNFYNVGTAVSDGLNTTKDWCFSVTFSNMEITSFHYAGFYSNKSYGSGNKYYNIYINAGSTNNELNKAIYGFYLTSDERCEIDLLNIEWGRYDYPLYIKNCRGLVAGSIHFEEVGLIGKYRGVVELECVSGVIENLEYFYTHENTDGFKLVHLGKGGVINNATSEKMTSYSQLLIETLSVEGLNTPDYKAFPTYGDRGLNNVKDGGFISRDVNDGEYIITINNYNYVTRLNDEVYYTEPIRDEHDNIIITKFGYVKTYGTKSNRPINRCCTGHTTYFATDENKYYILTGRYNTANTNAGWSEIGGINTSTLTFTANVSNFDLQIFNLTTINDIYFSKLTMQGTFNAIGLLGKINGWTGGIVCYPIALSNGKIYSLSITTDGTVELKNPLNNEFEPTWGKVMIYV